MTTRALQIECLLDPVIDPNTGDICSSGYTVYFYAAGTSTAKNVWTEKEKTNPFTSKSIGSDGTIQLYGDGIYKIVIEDVDGDTIHEWDDVKIEASNFLISSKSAAYTATPDDDLVLVDTDSANVTISLQAVANFTYPLVIKNTGSNQVTIDPNGAETIDGAATITLSTSAHTTLYPNTASGLWHRTVDVTVFEDSDGDTKIQTEETADEDIIRFDLGDATLTSAAEIMTLQAIDTTACKLEPTTDDKLDLGSATKQFRNAYIDGVAYIDDVAVEGVIFSETTAPTTAANEGGMFVKAVTGQTELFFVEESDGDEVQLTDSGAPVLPRSYLAGLTLSNDTDTDHDIAVAVGECRDSTNAYNLILSTIITKQIDATWAAGDDAGGMFTGSVGNSTWYHFFLIRKDSDGSIDAGFDTDVDAANIPTGYTYYRRIGTRKTDGSANLVGFTQNGDEVIADDPPLSIDNADLDMGAELRTIGGLPPDISTVGLLNVWTNNADGATQLYLSDINADNELPATAAAPLATLQINTEPAAGLVRIRTDTSQQIRARTSRDNTILRIVALGWIDRRGRDD